MTQTHFKPKHVMGVETENIIAALMVYAIQLDQIGQFSPEKFDELPLDEKKQWIWHTKNMLVAHPFYHGLWQTLKQEKSIKKRFKTELSFLYHKLKRVEVMLKDPRIQAILLDDLGVSPKSTMH